MRARSLFLICNFLVLGIALGDESINTKAGIQKYFGSVTWQAGTLDSQFDQHFMSKFPSNFIMPKSENLKHNYKGSNTKFFLNKRCFTDSDSKTSLIRKC